MACRNVEVDEQVRACHGLSDQVATTDGARVADDSGTFTALVDGANPLEPGHKSGRAELVEKELRKRSPRRFTKTINSLLFT
ncbi:hypothetical protein [Mycobacterium avium]|uniref:hypothetical protein n=1 Tax=Mycobacterium avium TaxID=1764 RepID=UPI001E4632C9|nr:hypothetical protein [Mycobacterium avium]